VWRTLAFDIDPELPAVEIEPGDLAGEQILD
jgi:hypothetical protein